ncbi:MAG: hypothetical protein QM831_35460 [Kofleriaceae bacterium]
MHKLALVVFLVACGGNSDSKVHVLVDAGSDSDTCNPLAQTGCATGEKCTWIYDLVSSDGTNILGHTGCAPDGDKAIHDTCTRNAAGAQGWDDCVKGSFCKAKRELLSPGGAGVCEAICDNNGSDPMCASGSTCVTYHNVFEASDKNVAGVCDYRCDPFDDNDAKHDGSAAINRPGTACQDYEECNGFPSSGALPTAFSCAREYNTDLHHRHTCTATDGNSLMAADPLSQVACSTASNGCSQGYHALTLKTVAGQETYCLAMCKPASCWMGNCGTDSQSEKLTGDPAGGHQCKPANIIVNDPAALPATLGAGGVNGDQCYFGWHFEIDDSNMLHTSEYSDTFGVCLDHSILQYDANNDGTNDTPWPKCDQVANPIGTGSAGGDGTCTPENGCRGASNFGCTNLADSGIMTFGKRTTQKLTNRTRLLDFVPPSASNQ